MPRRVCTRAGRGLEVLLAATCASLVTVGTALAAGTVQFLPQAEVRVVRNGNVTIVGPGEADTVTEVRVRLALQGERATSRYSLAYAPHREIYSRQSQFDNTAHILSAAGDWSLSPRSTFTLGADASRSQLQGIQPEAPDQPTTFVPRTTLDRFSLRLGGRVETGRRSYIAWDSGGSLVRYDQPPGGVFDDNHTVGAGLAWGYEVVRAVTLGVRYGFQDITFDRQEGTQTHTLQLRAARQFGEHTTGELQAGASRSETGAATRTDPAVGLSLVRTLTERTRFTLGAQQAVSSGSGLTSATLDRGGFVAWQTSTVRDRLGARVSAAYWHRESILEAQPVDTQTISTSEDLFIRFASQFEFGIFHSYSRQRASGTGAVPVDPYHSGGVALRWARPARRPQKPEQKPEQE